ncbi:MAG: hypothetical protein J7L45_01525 [Candidatus Aenigmarchaeota archaeon]|nr:hypothetical protein [Candidatus Aenigmarchaeota archaeon]
MKVGWQLKEEVPLFLIVFFITAGIIWYFNKNISGSAIFGTSFLVAAIVTSLEVIIDAIWESRKK